MARNTKSLESAQKHAIAGDYSMALSLVDSVLCENQYDVEALRLKGNIIELEIFDRENYNNPDQQVVKSPEMLKARACYEQALLLEPNNTSILSDLGTHWKNLGNNFKALQYFNRVIELLTEIPDHDSSKDDFVEALDGKIEILQQQGDLEGVRQLINEKKIYFGKDNSD